MCGRSFIFRVLANFTVGSARSHLRLGPPLSRARLLTLARPLALSTFAVVTAVFSFVFGLPALIWGFQPSLVRPL